MNNSGTLGYWNVIPYMKFVREFLEHEKLKSQYETLNFYCNWMFHSELNRGDWIADFFERINRSWQTDQSLNNPTITIKETAEQMYFRELKDELILLFKGHHFVTDFISKDEVWRIFVQIIIQDLLYKKLSFPSSKSANAIKRRIEVFNESEGRPMVPIKFSFQTDTESIGLWELVYEGHPGPYENGLTLRTPIKLP
jgi:hypothetical protein